MTDTWIRGATGIGMFLIGMLVMIEGIKALTGGRLSRTIGRFTRSPLTGAATGMACTAAMQSSSMTTVAAVGLVGAGALSFPQALGLIFGANVGTTITGWIVALLGFKVSMDAYLGPLLLIGALLSLLAKPPWSAAGRSLAGLSLLLLGLEVMQGFADGLQQVVIPESLTEGGLLGRLVLVGLGAFLTLITQSSSAGVAMTLAALHGDMIQFEQAAALVIGMDIGTTITALLAALGGSVATRRTAWAHVLYNLLCGVLALLLIDPFTEFAPWQQEPELSLVGFHSSFNLLGAIIAIPFAGPFARLVMGLVPARHSHATEHLDTRLHADPETARRAALGALEKLSLQVFKAYAGSLRGSARPAARTYDQWEAELGNLRRFMSGMQAPLVESEAQRNESLHHAWDHIVRFVDRMKRQGPFPDALQDPQQSRLGIRLAGALSTADQAWDQETRESLKRLSDEAKALDSELRSKNWMAASKGVVHLSKAQEQLRASRYLYRLSRHAWRIVHHLQCGMTVHPEESDLLAEADFEEED